MLKKLAGPSFGKRATPAQKTQAIQELRQKHKLELLLSVAQLPQATFYYHLKRMGQVGKYNQPGQKSQAYTMKTRDDTVTGASPWNCIDAASI